MLTKIPGCEMMWEHVLSHRVPSSTVPIRLSPQDRSLKGQVDPWSFTAPTVVLGRGMTPQSGQDVSVLKEYDGGWCLLKLLTELLLLKQALPPNFMSG